MSKETFRVPSYQRDLVVGLIGVDGGVRRRFDQQIDSLDSIGGTLPGDGNRNLFASQVWPK